MKRGITYYQNTEKREVPQKPTSPEIAPIPNEPKEHPVIKPAPDWNGNLFWKVQ